MSILLLSLFASGVKKYFVHASITFFSLFCTFFTSFWLTFVVCFSRSSLLRCLVWFGLVWRSKSNTFAPMLFYVYVVHGCVTFFGLFLIELCLFSKLFLLGCSALFGKVKVIVLHQCCFMFMLFMVVLLIFHLFLVLC